MMYVSTDNALKPSGHYSQAVIHNGLIYISNQLPIDPDTGEKKKGTVEEETERILTNIEMILQEAGSNRDDVIRTTVYITDIADWDKVNMVYSRFFGTHKPARSVVVVKELHFGCKVGIEAVAGSRRGQ
ncbi:Rid family detoxifying hydrolase [Brevibacillus migulae]|uniref:Rid family detoxifying hydrolase n=1 Tax=Brevibacillus migulae TaxID=1644114 RepID=UPI00106E8796|nr:Rid family detoxifying hydrolase [Brevibacillus migulae]